MTEKPKPVEKHSESSKTSTPGETAVADSRDRGQLVERQRAEKAHEENPNRPQRLKVSGTFGKQDLSDVHIMKKGDTLQSVVEKHLGADVSAVAVKAFMVETALLSGFKNPFEIKVGNAVQFPPLEQVRSENPHLFKAIPHEQTAQVQHPGGMSVLKDQPVDNSIRPPVIGGEHLASKINENPPNHKVAAHETSTDIARAVLGPGSTREQIELYSTAICDANKIHDGSHLTAGRQLIMPKIGSDNSFSYVNPQQKDEVYTVRAGTVDIVNARTGTFNHVQIENDGSYEANHTGPSEKDNYTEWYNGVNKGLTTRRELNGKRITTFESGSTEVVDLKTGLEQTTFPDKTASVYDPNDGTRTDHVLDGGTTVSDVIRDASGNDTVLKTEDYRPDGSKTTKWTHGTVIVEDRVTGIGHQRAPQANGYVENGWGPNLRDDYVETYDSTTHVTSRTEAVGTPAEKTTTSFPNGARQVDFPNGKGYRREPDGTEHHWGPEAGDKFSTVPDSKHIDESRHRLETVIAERNDIPAAKKEKFEADIQSFEKRLHDHHVPSEEAAKSYDQIVKLLTTSDSKSVVPSANRALCAIGFMHQLAYPEHTDQGEHNTCNVTTLAERLQTREPSKAAEMITSVALTGHWTAADGKTIVIDKNSLRPGADECEYPPKFDGARSYATQLLNLVMANDATQRRQPAQFYQQGSATGAGDYGERLVDKDGNVLQRIVVDATSVGLKPFDSPEVNDTEIAEVGGRIMGDEHFFLAHKGASRAVDTFDSQQELENHLQRMRDQGTFPAVIQVAGRRTPIADFDEVDAGSHVVSITNYDPVHHRVKISNQWGINKDRWVDAEALYKNTLQV